MRTQPPRSSQARLGRLTAPKGTLHPAHAHTLLRGQLQGMLREVQRVSHGRFAGCRYRAPEAPLEPNTAWIAHQSTWERPCWPAVLVDHLSTHDGHAVALHGLDPAARAEGQVVPEFGRQDAQRVEVDEVEVGLHARAQLPAVVQAHHDCGLGSLLPHHHLQRELLATRPVPHPVREHGRRSRRLALHHHVRPAIRKAGDNLLVAEHLAERFEVAAAVVVQGLPQHTAMWGAGPRQHIVGKLQERLPLALRTSSQRVFNLRLGVRRPWPQKPRRIQHNVEEPMSGVFLARLVCLLNDCSTVGRISHALCKRINGRARLLLEPPVGP
mmetsp:Transcript_33141/g.91590  ORF Transcript_33141/g.91590 Transcript_33141/m.91590 type:complete len:326 (-) Transcript_33141:1111-2088(-)